MSNTAGTTHHSYAEGYSGRNPVPTVQGFNEQQAHRQEQMPPSPPDSEHDAVDANKPLPPNPQTPMDGPQLGSQSTPAPTGDGTNTAPETPRKKEETKEEIMNKAKASQSKPTDRLKNRASQGTVRDPVTGQDVVIRDAELSSMSRTCHFGRRCN